MIARFSIELKASQRWWDEGCPRQWRCRCHASMMHKMRLKENCRCYQCPKKGLYRFSLTLAVHSAWTSVRTVMCYVHSCSLGTLISVRTTLFHASSKRLNAALAPVELIEWSVMAHPLGSVTLAAACTVRLWWPNKWRADHACALILLNHDDADGTCSNAPQALAQV